MNFLTYFMFKQKPYMHFSPKQKCSWYLCKTDALFWQSNFLQLYIFLQFLLCQELLSNFGALHCQGFTFNLPCLMFMLLFLLSCLIFLCPITSSLVWLVSLDSYNKRGVWAKCSFCLIVKTQVWPNGPKICARRTKTDCNDRAFTA